MCTEVWILQIEESRMSQEAEQSNKKIAHWSFAKYWIKLLKFACKFPAVFAWGSCRGQAPPVLSQGRSVSFHQCRGAAQLSRDSACLPTTLYSLELGWGRCMGKYYYQYRDGCRFWTLNLIKALPGASHNSPSRRHIHDPHCALRNSCSERLPHLLKVTWQGSGGVEIPTQCWIRHPLPFHYA